MKCIKSTCISTVNLGKTLYIVPTPIGNLQDITYRAVLILCQVDYVIVENFRRAKILFDFFSIKTSVYIMHRYNEHIKVPMFISKLQAGYSMALISDAGSPLISDPGYELVKSCHEKKIKVVSLPGPCAAITALCGSGLPANRFCFEGFLPSKQCLRINHLKMLLEEKRTLIFYDVKNRVINSLRDMISVFGAKRYVVLVRELSKIWECIYGASLDKLLLWVQKDKMRIQGEIVLVVDGFRIEKYDDGLSPKTLRVMELLALELPVKKAAILTGHICSVRKNILYKKYLLKRLNKVT